jgi:hypothetical protein
MREALQVEWDSEMNSPTAFTHPGLPASGTRNLQSATVSQETLVGLGLKEFVNRKLILVPNASV